MRVWLMDFENIRGETNFILLIYLNFALCLLLPRFLFFFFFLLNIVGPKKKAVVCFYLTNFSLTLIKFI